MRFVLFPLALAVVAAAQTTAPSKVAIIQFQQAVLGTQEGQAAQAALKAKFDPRKNELDKRQAGLQAIQEKLQKGGATLTADVRSKMEKDLAAGGRSLNNDAEDLNNDVQEEENKIMQGMATRMGDIIKDYATKNGYAVVVDVSSQQSAVLWASPSVNITNEIVKLYDQAHGKSGSSPAPAGAKPQAPANPAPSAVKPPAPATAKPPATKKQ